MNRIIRSSIVLAALAAATGAFAQTFTAGNLVIYRIGGNATAGTGAALTNRGNFVWLDEYTTDGVTRVQSIMMPTNYFGANSPLIGIGSAFGNGLITRSTDGRFILVGGYGARTNQFNFSLQSAFGTEVPRVIGLVGGNGHIDTTTTQTNQDVDNEEPRAATSTDGTNIWFSGSASGVRYTQRVFVGPSPVATQLVVLNAGFITNLRQLNIFNNQLYCDSFQASTNFFVLTNNVPGQLPTSTNNLVFSGLVGLSNNIPFYTSPEAFVFFKLNAGGSDPLDTLYVADSGTNNASGSIRKFSLVGATWSNSGSIRASGAVGLTGQTRITGSTTNVDLWIIRNVGTVSGNDSLASATDSSGYNGAASGNANVNTLATSANSVSWRGIAFSPVGGETFPTGPQNLSVGPLLDVFTTASTGCSATSTDTYSVANFGTGTMTWEANSPSNWVSFAPASGSLGSGGSITVTVTLNANVTSLPSGTNTTAITFTNTTVGSSLGTQTRRVQLIMKNQSISPSSDYTPSGPFHGPFSPATNVVTVFNGSTPINLIVTNTAYVPATTPWLNISPTTVSLGACSSTNITISVIPAIATNLANGNYSTVVVFSNATAGTVIDSINVQLSVGGTLFCDDFSTYTQNANLVPQQGWAALPAGGGPNEPHLTNGAVYVAAVNTTAGADEPFKNIPVLSNTTVFAGMVMIVTSAPPVGTTAPSRLACFFNGQNEGAFAVHYLSARDTGTGTYVLCARGNSFTDYSFGTTPLNYGQSYRVILQGETSISNTLVYVDPVNDTFATNTAYLAWHTTDPGSSPRVGSFSIQNTFSAATSIIPGVAFFKICITTNYTEAFNDIGGAPPTDPFTTWQTFYFGCTGCSQAQGSADPDGDGMSNTNEFLAGFNPTNSAASLHIISIVNTGNDTKVTYLGANGDSGGSPGPKTNVLEYTTGTANGSYTNNNWLSVGAGATNILTGGTGSGLVTNSVDTGGATNTPSRYYRVRVLVP